MQLIRYIFNKRNIILSICFFISYFVTCVLIFPSNIKFLEGQEQILNFKLPFKALILNDSIETLKINDVDVTENLEVSLNRDTILHAEKSGTASMVINAFGIPIKNISLDFLPDMQIIPCGLTVGVTIKTDGIMILGTGHVNSENGITSKPSENVLKPGDLIIRINDQDLNNKEDFKNIIENSEGTVSLMINRNNEIIEQDIEPVLSIDTKTKKIGAWIRDSTQGIGTITYINPTTNQFGALGHGIIDIDTKKLMSVKEGSIYKSVINDIKKGKKGSPGELVGNISDNQPIGTINSNTFLGIYGKINDNDFDFFEADAIKIAFQNEIKEGPATIRTNIDGTKVEEYDIYIESVNKYSKDDAKGMIIKITDPRLISKTNGIVQGMSGSPIIQDGKLVGAVTHVFVQEPSKGYGIFIENMLKQNK